MDDGAAEEVAVGVTRQEHAEDAAAALPQLDANLGIMLADDAV